jgi:hypothetical protein
MKDITGNLHGAEIGNGPHSLYEIWGGSLAVTMKIASLLECNAVRLPTFQRQKNTFDAMFMFHFTEFSEKIAASVFNVNDT